MSKTESNYDGIVELEPPIKILRAKARHALPEHVVDGHDTERDDGDRITVETRDHRDETTQEIEHNLTAMYQPAPSTTGNLEILVTEAELADDGAELGNPHIPGSVEVRDAALAQLEEDGLEPAWEQ